MKKKIERCFICDDPTGRAGAVEDSIYCYTCDDERKESGPFCEECWKKHEHYE